MRGLRGKAMGAVLLGVLLHAGVIGSVLLDRQRIHARAREIAAPGTPETKVVMALASFVRDELHHCNLAEVRRMPLLLRLNYLANRFGIGPKTALDHGGYYDGACDSSSRVLMEMLGGHGIPSRFVILSDQKLESLHTLLEVRYQGAWGVVDPLYNIVYRHPGGQPASITELRDDEALFLANAKGAWEYGYGPNRKEKPHPYNLRRYNFKNVHYFNYDKLGMLSLGAHRLLAWAGGEDATLWLHRPNFYAYPGLTTLVLSDLAALGLLALGLAWHGISRRRASARRPPGLL